MSKIYDQPVAKRDLFASLPPYFDGHGVEQQLAGLLAQSRTKIVVLDDDPTGVQFMISQYTPTAI